MEIHDELKIVGENIKKLRKARGLTQFDLANVAGLSRTGTISDIENAKVPTLNFDVLESLAKALNVTVHDLTRPFENIRIDGIKPGLEALVKNQNNLLAISEPRIANREIDFLNEADVDLTSEGYLMLLRYIRMIQRSSPRSESVDQEP